MGKETPSRPTWIWYWIRSRPVCTVLDAKLRSLASSKYPWFLRLTSSKTRLVGPFCFNSWNWRSSTEKLKAAASQGFYGGALCSIWAKTSQKMLQNHNRIWHFQPYPLVKHYLGASNPLCKFEITFWIFWNIRFLVEFCDVILPCLVGKNLHSSEFFD